MRCGLSLLLLQALLPLSLAQGDGAEKLFRDMEKKVKAAQTVQVNFDIVIERRKLSGSLLLTKDNKARLKVSGDFGAGDGKATFKMISDGKQIRVTRTPKFEREKSGGRTPKFHALVSTTVSRAGLWLSYVLMPREQEIDLNNEIDPESLRLEVYDFKAGAADKVGEREAKVITYRLGQKADAPSQAAEVTLWMDAKTELPLKRVVVQKEGKEGREGIRITETYHEFTLDPKVDAKAFELPK